MPLSPGTRLGVYEIQDLLGAGGMGEVYRARDMRLGRDVALKTLSPELVQDPERLERFHREARTVAGLSHPNIVVLHSIEESDGIPFLTMELVEGETLDRQIAPGGLPDNRVEELAAALADALAYAHKAGVIHRDLKPANVMVARDGRIKVLDFGLAKLAAQSESPNAATEMETALVTREGVVMGTLPYMSPEQLQGRELDPRTDLFSLGVLLYESACGERPFQGNSQAELATSILRDSPQPLAERRPRLFAPLLQTIARCLEKRPADRFNSAAEILGVLRGTTSVPAAAPIPRGSLPAPRTRFIGRERELAECAALLADSRILTVTGVGGTGKTRFAIRLAGSMAPAAGAWFVDLAPLSDPAGVVATVAAALGIREVADRELIDLVCEQLHAGPSLLVLDNCEHLLAACAEAAETLLHREPGVRILATSREALGIEGERVFELRPMALPDSGQAAETSDAVSLFVDRARGVQPEFALTPANLPAVLEICRRLDGIPLALELAATRVKVLSVDQIRARLDDRFRLLTGGHRGALPRQQTLLAAIRWSDEQLTPEEQAAFRALAAFAGGWGLAEAARVTGEDEMTTIDRLTSLVNKSLVMVERDGEEPRYRLLETVRQYALDALDESGRAEATRTLHAEAFLVLAERAYRDRWQHGEQWCDRLEADHDNLAAALDHFQRTAPERFLELTGALAWFWHARSYFREGRARITSALAQSAADPPRSARARAMWGAALVLALQGDAAGARRWMGDSLRMLRELGDPIEIADALEGIGWSQFASGEEEAGYASFEECFRINAANGDPYRTTRARVGLAQLALALDRPAEAEPLAREILAFAEPRNDRRQEHFAWHFLADCALMDGRYAESLELYRKSLRLAQATGDRLETGFEIQGVAMSASGLGQHELALRLAAAVEAEFRRIGADFQVRFWNALLERHIGGARDVLGAEAGRIEREGEGLPIQGAIQMALERQPV